MIINDPQTLAEVEAEFARYETALVTNDVAALDNFFWRDARVIRYGGGENLYGFDEIAAFRAGRSPAGLERTLFDVAHAYSALFGVAVILMGVQIGLGAAFIFRERD